MPVANEIIPVEKELISFSPIINWPNPPEFGITFAAVAIAIIARVERSITAVSSSVICLATFT